MHIREQKRSGYLPIDFKPNISLSPTFNHWTDSHQADNEGLPFLNGDMHLLSDIRTPEEVPAWNHAYNVV
jgi:hypothetical protein